MGVKNPSGIMIVNALLLSWKAPQHHFLFLFFLTLRTIQLNLVHNKTSFLHHIQYGCKIVPNMLCSFMEGGKKACHSVAGPSENPNQKIAKDA